MEQLQASGTFAAQEAREAPPGTCPETLPEKRSETHPKEHSEEQKEWDGVPEQTQTSFTFSDAVPAV